MSEASHGGILANKSYLPLPRNRACLQCKKHKVKCDGIRPICSPCMRGHVRAIRSANRNNHPVPPRECSFTALHDPSQRGEEHIALENAEGVSGSVAWEAERLAMQSKIDALEKRLASYNMDASPSDNKATSRVYSSETFPPVNTDQRGAEEANSGPSPRGDAAFGADSTDSVITPAFWPVSLPSPPILDHLVEIFFKCVPQLPRMIHRATLQSRLRLPPTHPDFPHASLLHAICASASAHTAWVISLNPEKLEEVTQRINTKGVPMELFQDFGLSQAYAAKGAIDILAAHYSNGTARSVFHVIQASIILSEVFFQKGLPLQGCLMECTASRLIKSTEIGNRNDPTRYSDSIFHPQDSWSDREEAYATIWMAFVLDSGFAMNSYWSQSLSMTELLCPLPTSSGVFRQNKWYDMAVNPQTAHTPEVLTSHPVNDPFVFVIKASILVSRTTAWLRTWHQRECRKGDEMQGMSWTSYQDLTRDIHSHQLSVPALSQAFFEMERGHPTPFDANSLLMYILPSLALCLLQEPFAQWSINFDPITTSIQQSCEDIMRLLHVIPTNLDISLIMTPLVAFSIFTIGRIVAIMARCATEHGQFSVAAKYRIDFASLQNILSRYGEKHALGLAMSSFLEDYIQSKDASLNHDSKRMCKAFMINSKQHENVCLSKTPTVVQTDNLSWHTSAHVPNLPLDPFDTPIAMQLPLIEPPICLTTPVEAASADFMDAAGLFQHLSEGSNEVDEYMRRPSAHTNYGPITEYLSTETGLTPNYDRTQTSRQVTGPTPFASATSLPDSGLQAISDLSMNQDSSVLQYQDYTPMIDRPEHDIEMQTASMSFQDRSQAIDHVEPAGFPFDCLSDVQIDSASLNCLANQISPSEASHAPYSTLSAQSSAPHQSYRGPIYGSH